MAKTGDKLGRPPPFRDEKMTPLDENRMFFRDAGAT